MIYGLLIGIILAALFTSIANRATPDIPMLGEWDRQQARMRSVARLVANIVFIITLCSFIGLLISGS